MRRSGKASPLLRCRQARRGAGARPAASRSMRRNCRSPDTRSPATAASTSPSTRPLPLRSGIQGLHRRRTRRAARNPACFARQAQRSLHARLEPVAARRRQRQGNASSRRDGIDGLRLRHRQRRLDPQRSRDPGLVAGFEEDRDLPAGPAQDRLDDAGRHPRRPSERRDLEVPAGRRQGRDHDRARRHRRAPRQTGTAPEDAAGPASLDPVRRRQLRRAAGKTCSGRPTARRSRSCPRRATTSRRGCAWPTSPPARCATCCTNGADLFRERQRRGQLALPAAVERSAVVQRAQRLGQPVPLRPGQRQAQARGDDRRRQRHRSAARGSGVAHRCGSAASVATAGANPYYQAVLQGRARRRHADAADAGGRRPHGDAVAGRRFFVDAYSTPTTPPVTLLRSADDGTHGRHRRARRHLAPAGRGLDAADADHGQGARRQDRPVRPDVQAVALRCREEVSDRRLHLSGPADRIGRRPQLQRRTRRPPGAGRTGLHRRRDRRHGHAVAFQVLPRRLRWRHRRQHPARPGRRTA